MTSLDSSLAFDLSIELPGREQVASLHGYLAQKFRCGAEVSTLEQLVAPHLRLEPNDTLLGYQVGETIDTRAFSGRTVVGGSHDTGESVVITDDAIWLDLPYGYSPEFYEIRDNLVYAKYAREDVEGVSPVVRPLTPPVKIDVVSSREIVSVPLPVRELVRRSLENVLTSKARTLGLLRRAGVPTPQPLGHLLQERVDELLMIPSEFLGHFKTYFEGKPDDYEIVLKPDAECQGRGVVILNRASLDQVAEVSRLLDLPSLSDAEYELMAMRYDEILQVRFPNLSFWGNLLVEERIHSRPIQGFDDSFSWNIRAIVVGNETIGMFARVGKSNWPVNLCFEEPEKPDWVSIDQEFEPAQAKTLEEIGGLTRYEQLRLEAVLDRIKRLFPNSILGVDAIFDRAGEPFVIEINGALTGGISNLHQLYSSKRFAQRAADAIVRQVRAGSVSILPRSSTEERQFLMGYLYGISLGAMRALLTDTADNPTTEEQLDTARTILTAFKTVVEKLDPTAMLEDVHDRIGILEFYLDGATNASK